MSEFQNSYDASFDIGFQSALDGGLKSLPWVGKNYAAAKVRALVVGESHYTNKESAAERQRQGEEYNHSTSFTRECVWESCIDYWWEGRTWSNLQRALSGSSKRENAELWQKIAYYNFVQRLMDYTVKERPNWQDFADGWTHFVEVVKALKPDVCVFCGISASYTFDYMMENLGISHEKVQRDCFTSILPRPRLASIRVDQREIKLIFIRHCGSFFSWPTWRNYLKQQAPEAMAYLSADNEEMAPYTPEPPEQDTTETTVDVPMHLSHKPIYAANYDDLTGYDVGRDAKYVSVGLAQYDPEGISVKIFRESNGRWSRQSEELPLFRAFTPARALLKSILMTQDHTAKDGAPLVVKNPVLTEIFVNALGDPDVREELVREMKEMACLIHQIDLEKIGLSLPDDL